VGVEEEANILFYVGRGLGHALARFISRHFDLLLLIELVLDAPHLY
jgi:hypothetical protein